MRSIVHANSAELVANLLAPIPDGAAVARLGRRLRRSSAITGLLVLSTVIGSASVAESAAGPANDLDGDGVADFVVPAKPTMSGERPEFVVGSGATGKPLLRFTAVRNRGYEDPLVRFFRDVDGDGVLDLAIADGGDEAGRDRTAAGIVYFISGRTGTELPGRIAAKRPVSQAGFGSAMECLDSAAGPNARCLLVGAERAEVQPGLASGGVYLYSGEGLKDVKEYPGRQADEGYGGALCAGFDWDADGVEDFAVGAPGFAVDAKDGVGRVEVRSGRLGTVLFEAVGTGEEEAFGTALCALRMGAGPERPCIAVSSGGRASLVDAKGGVHHGLVSVFDPRSPLPVLTIRGGPVPEAFGITTCALAPVRATERWRLVIGARPYSEAGGKIYGYTMDSAEPQFTVKGDRDDFRAHEYLRAVGDINGDGVGDFVSGDVVRSGRDGLEIRRVAEPPGAQEGGNEGSRR